MLVTFEPPKVILGAHYETNGHESNGKFERGLYVTSLACRCGSLLAIPLSSLLIKWTAITWRGVAGMAACAAFAGVVVFYAFLTDSPGKLHDPQNPIRPVPQSSGGGGGGAGSPYHPSFHSWTPQQPSPSQRAVDFCSSVHRTVAPSIRAILSARIFWAVAAAHAGATMVKGSERIMGTYFRDTSFGVVTESKAGAMTVFLSLGMLGGLLVGGRAFARAADREKGGRAHPPSQSPVADAAQLGTKNMIAFLYCLSICMCYTLSFLAMPMVRRALHLPVLVLILQALATLGLGFGVAVQFYHIPPIVAATFGRNRGLYTAYTDGVAALVASIVWRVVGGAVEEGNPQGGGWAYGWAAVALLLILCGSLMVKIVELYLRHDASKNHDEHIPTESPPDLLNTSWMEDEIRSIEASPLRKPGAGLNILPSSALEFIGSSPGRLQTRGRKSLMAVDSRDEEDTQAADLLGIDDDGSLLIPTMNVGPRHSAAHDLVSFNSIFDSTKRDVRDSDSQVRESSVFDDPYDEHYNKGPFNSFEL